MPLFFKIHIFYFSLLVTKRHSNWHSGRFLCLWTFPPRLANICPRHNYSMTLCITSHWHALRLFLFGIGFMYLRWEYSSTSSTWKYCNMNFKSCETCVFTKGSFGPDASLLLPLSFPEVHTMTWKLMAKLYLTFWNLLCNSHMKSLELCEIKSFFHLFFQLGHVFINQSNSDCVWWKVKTKLIFLFYSSHVIFQTKLFLIIFKEFNVL